MERKVRVSWKCSCDKKITETDQMPSTSGVWAKPVLFVPPWNRFSQMTSQIVIRFKSKLLGLITVWLRHSGLSLRAWQAYKPQQTRVAPLATTGDHIMTDTKPHLENPYHPHIQPHTITITGSHDISIFFSFIHVMVIYVEQSSLDFLIVLCYILI